MKKRDALVNSKQTTDEPGNKCSSAELKSKSAYVKLKNEATREAAARAATINTSSQPPLPTASPVVVQAGGATEIPLTKDSKFNIRVFSGNKLPKGLGAGFKHWGRGFGEELEMAQDACGHLWPVKNKVSKLGSCSRGEAEEILYGLRDEWWAPKKTLTYAMKEVESDFSRTFPSAQVAEFFNERKPTTESWHSHYLCLMTVRNVPRRP